MIFAPLADLCGEGDTAVADHRGSMKRDGGFESLPTQGLGESCEAWFSKGCRLLVALPKSQRSGEYYDKHR